MKQPSGVLKIPGPPLQQVLSAVVTAGVMADCSMAQEPGKKPALYAWAYVWH